jgi:hypothetical protein
MQQRARHLPRLLLLAGTTLFSQTALAETLLRVDARAPAPQLETGYLRTGMNVSPSGRKLEVNNRYLMLDGHPWLPVMGEFHYTRFAAEYWDEELAKMRAAGVDIVSTYIIWQHHEEHAGRFDWSGDRDLRRFVELCAKHQMKVFVRLGPWVHAEVRFGGIPDWVVNAMPTRADDPAYLSYVGRFFAQTAAQVRGLLWKDGGPIIGVQLENEYNKTGPNQGRAHIASLKKLALEAGFDVPLYTVTAWDNTIYPPREVAPVFGSYPDAPWSASPQKLPANEAYLFRFQSRVTGDTSPASLAATAAGDADNDASHTPFLSAEYAGGLPSMYRRRTVLSPDDVASLLTIQIGSGVNLYGYYMFHGGRNPPGRPTREENTGIGGYNDLPLISYDFQAAFGEYGQAHPVLSKIRPMHEFLASFGEGLAPMVPRKPERVPSGPGDVSTPRFAVRSLGDSAFLFVSNHVRLYPPPVQKAVRFSVQLPGGTVELPRAPIDVPSGAYFVWPINMSLGGARLSYATAQPVAQIATGEGPLYVFRAVDGIPVEFAFDASSTKSVTANGGRVVRDADRIIVSADFGRATSRGRTRQVIQIRARDNALAQALLLSEAQAERLWVLPFKGKTRLLITDAVVFADGDALELRSRGNAQIRLGVYPALSEAAVRTIPGDAAASAVSSQQPRQRNGGADLRRNGTDGIFQIWEARLPERHADVRVTPLRASQPAPPIMIGGPAKAAIQPAPETYASSAAWTLSIPPEAIDSKSDAYLLIDYRGDVGRLFSGTEMIDDHYYNGLTWEVGLKRFASLLDKPFTLTVLPMRQDAPIYIEPEYQLHLAPGAQAAEIVRVRIEPEYRLRIE